MWKGHINKDFKQSETQVLFLALCRLFVLCYAVWLCDLSALPTFTSVGGFIQFKFLQFK